jgi:cold shock CspA family protein
MRFDGKLEKWHDGRGFGFIMPTRGGDSVFVHISAFPHDGRRPQVGEVLSFGVEPAGDGKRRAVNVQRPGVQRQTPSRAPEPRRPAARSEPFTPYRRERHQGSRFVGRIAPVVVVMAAVAAYAAYSQRSSTSRHVEPDTAFAPRGAVPAAPDTGRFRCDGRFHCSQMTSCAEATFFLKNCPGTKMDGDHDGIPCETQWCR